MESSVPCPKCQTVSPPGAAFCFRCGTLLPSAPTAAAGVPAAPTPAPPPHPPPFPAPYGAPFPPAPPPMGYELRRNVDRTRTGVLLLAAGAFLSWIPAIGFVGGLLSLVGAILVIMGRHAFGEKHARNVGIAIVLYILGLIGGFILAANILSAVGAAVYLPPAQAQAAILSSFSSILIGAIVLGILTGPASVFFLWELLNDTGKALILLSYFVGIAFACMIYVLIMPQLTTALAAMFATTPPDAAPILALDSQLNSLKLLSAIPALLSAGAALVAWSRIDRGEIPKRRY